MGEFCVYMHINRANGKRYVGITRDNPLHRWANGKGYRRNKHFYDAILRYGWDNFDHIILYTGLTESEACAKEQELIKEYGTQDKRLGYNLTNGGEFFRHSEESKRLISENRKGKGRVKRTAEQVERMKASHAGGAKPIAVLCIETGESFNCINDAARAKNISKKQISACCRSIPHYNTAGGLHWKYMN